MTREHTGEDSRYYDFTVFTFLRDKEEDEVFEFIRKVPQLIVVF